MKPILLSIMLLLATSALADKLCAEYGPAGDMLCVVSSSGRLSWYVFTGCEDILTIDPPETELTVTSISASASGRYLAILSSAEGHPVLGIFKADTLDYGEKPEMVRSINPYPGTVANVRWDQDAVLFEADVDVNAGRQETREELLQYRYDPATDDLTQR